MRVTINNKKYDIPGRNISIANGQVISDGQVRMEFDSMGTKDGLVIENIEGNIGKLECKYPVVINGDVKGNILAKGPISCGDVKGSVKGRVVNCGDVAGSVSK